MGSLELVLGCMYSGKTTELIRRMRREQIAEAKVALFKPALDDRYSTNEVVSHNEEKLVAIPAKNFTEVEKYVRHNRPDFLGIDELQFFDDRLIPFVQGVVHDKDNGLHIIASALPLDFRGEPFKFLNSEQHIGEIMPHSSKITTLTARCTYKENGKKCAKEAQYTQRLLPDGSPAPYTDPLIKIGGKDDYEARCAQHHFVPGRPR